LGKLDESSDHYKVDSNHTSDHNHDDRKKIDNKKHNHHHNHHNHHKHKHDQQNDDHNHHNDDHSDNNDNKIEEISQNNLSDTALANKDGDQRHVTSAEKKDLSASKFPQNLCKRNSKTEKNSSGNKIDKHIAHYDNLNSRPKFDPLLAPSPLSLVPQYDSPSLLDRSILPVPPPAEGQRTESPQTPQSLRRKKVGFDYDEDRNHEKRIGYV
jgi:hypothetical protein